MAQPKANGATYPKGATQWGLSKRRLSPDGQIEEKWQRCALHLNGAAVDMFDITSFPPTVDRIAEVWGRGVYRLAYLRADRKSAGSSPVVRIDAAGLPDRGCYPNEPKAAPPPAPPSPGEALAAMVAGPPATVDLSSFVFMWNLVSAQNAQHVAAAQAAADARATEAERRADRRERETALFYQTLRGAAAPLAPAADSAVLAELRQLRERMDEMGDGDDDDDQGDGVDPNIAAILAAVKEHSPAVLSQIASLLEGKK